MNQTQYKYINLDYLDMMTEGDAEMQKEILGIVVEEITNDIPRMIAFFRQGDMENTHQLAHKFKSTLAFVGNDLMTNANQEAELITKIGGETEKLPGLFNIIEEMQPKVLDELQAMYDSL